MEGETNQWTQLFASVLIWLEQISPNCDKWGTVTDMHWMYLYVFGLWMYACIAGYRENARLSCGWGVKYLFHACQFKNESALVICNGRLLTVMNAEVQPAVFAYVRTVMQSVNGSHESFKWAFSRVWPLNEIMGGGLIAILFTPQH